MSKVRYIGTIKCLLQEIDFNIKDLLKRYTVGHNSYSFRYFYKIKECHTEGAKTIVTADIYVTEATKKESVTVANNKYYTAELDNIRKECEIIKQEKLQFYLNVVSNILLIISTFILFNGWIYHREYLMLVGQTVVLNATYLTIIFSLLGLLASLVFLTINIRSVFFHIYLFNLGVFSFCLYRAMGEESFVLFASILLINLLVGFVLNKITKKTRLAYVEKTAYI